MICQPWEPLRRLMEHIYGRKVICFSSKFYVTEITSIATVLNPAAHFYLFCAFGSKFRNILREIFCNKRNVGEETSGNSGTTGTTIS